MSIMDNNLIWRDSTPLHFSAVLVLKFVAINLIVVEIGYVALNQCIHLLHSPQSLKVKNGLRFFRKRPIN